MRSCPAHLPLARRPTVALVSLVLALLWTLGACSSAAPAGAPAQAAERPPASEHTGTATKTSPLAYVALGDSYSSAPLVPVTDVANGCFRSSANYPALVAKKLGAKLEDRSCGGARIAELSASEHPDVPAQATAVTPNTNLVTIGIGGNDQGVFGRLTRRCAQLRALDPAGAPCRQEMTAGGRDVLRAALTRMGRDLTVALRRIRQRAPQAQVLVVGYPQIVSPDHTCSRLPLARGDYAYAARTNLALNAALRGAAKASGSTYVDVYAASLGHDVCSADAWINGSVTDQRRALAYHPFAVEQAAVADLVVAATRVSP